MATRAQSGAGAPSNNPFASASLYVGDLASDVTEATLFELFNAVGPVASIRVCRDATTRRSLGYAYVNFHSVQDAERALDTMNFTNIRGKQCRIMWSQRDPRLRQSGKGNIFVKNLHESIDNKTLYDTFSVFGNILSCKVVMDKGDGKSRGYGYVHYVDDKSAKKAIEGVNGMKISDREVHAELFKPREERMKNFKFTNVYVKYIPKNMTQDHLRKLFETETGGEVTDLYLWKHDYGISACLNFKEPDMAKLAVEKLNGREIKNIDLGLPPDGVVEPSVPSELITDIPLTSEEESKKDKDDTTTTADDAEEVPTGTDDTGDAKKDSDDTTTTTDDDKKVAPVQPPVPSVVTPVKLYVARAQKRKERKEYLARQQKRRGVGSRRNYTGANLYVKNLSPDVDDNKLKEMFSSFGNITSAKVMRENNSPNGKSRGFGFVAFEKKEAATRAIHEMTNTLHHGKPLYVSRAQTKAFRQRFIIKQLRSKRMRNSNYSSMGNQGGGYDNRQSGGYGGPRGYGGGPQQQQPSYGQQMGGFQQRQQMGAVQQFPGGYNPMMNPMQHRFGQPIGYTPNVALMQQQQMAAAQRQQQLQQQLQHQQHVAQQQQQVHQLLSQQQQIPGGSAAQPQIASSINQMSSQQQQLVSQHQRSASMGHTQQSQPAQSLHQSGPQSASINQSIYSSQRQMAIAGGGMSQPHISSVPTGQHSVSQLSAGGGASAPVLEVNPLTSEMLKSAKPAEKKRLIGERLFPKIQVVEPRLAGKITGMLLEMDNTELLVLLSEQKALMNKINEALAVLKDHQQKQSQQNPGSTKNPSSQNPAVGSANN